MQAAGVMSREVVRGGVVFQYIVRRAYESNPNPPPPPTPPDTVMHMQESTHKVSKSALQAVLSMVQPTFHANHQPRALRADE